MSPDDATIKKSEELQRARESDAAWGLVEAQNFARQMVDRANESAGDRLADAVGRYLDGCQGCIEEEELRAALSAYVQGNDSRPAQCNEGEKP